MMSMNTTVQKMTMIIFCNSMFFFHFHIPVEGHYFDGQLQSTQCTYVNAETHMQCHNRVVIGGKYCWVHSLKFLHLRILPSGIPNGGRGVYAVDTSKDHGDVVIKKDKKICDYNGQIITQQELDHRYTEWNYTAPYTVQISEHQGLYEDAALLRGIGSVINENKDRSNCRFGIYRGHAIIVATRNIINYEELFLNYGPAYRIAEAGVQSSTNHSQRHV